MKILQKATAILITLLIVSDVFPALAIKAEQLPEETVITPDNARISDEILRELPVVTPDGAETSVPDEAPMFSAKLEFFTYGYRVKGTFTDFPADTSLVWPMYSLDGENWQACDDTYWNLEYLGDENLLSHLQNQPCLLFNDEPLKSYLAGKLDRFYLKLQITRENGVTFDTQAAVIERGGPRPVPEGIIPQARFTSAMKVMRPRPLRGTQGQYQLTVHPDATPEEIVSLLPDTIPVNIQILPEDPTAMAEGTADCPVTWKPLSLPQLTPGSRITIADAAEELAVPADTLLNTPMGIFQLTETPVFNSAFSSDEISLVLNVVAENENPTGVLSAGNEGLSMSFYLKPTGATSIRAYTIPEGGTEWTELPCLPLTESINAQPATANSGYTLVLSKNQEPYRSYLAAQNAGDEPDPFFVGFKIEGGVYDGRQLILPWPGTYELPPNLPDLKGSGGNENNIGAGNKDDSTEEGQRPDLPQNPEDSTEGQQPNLPQNPEDSTEGQQPNLPQNPENSTEEQQTDLPQNPEDKIPAKPNTISDGTSDYGNRKEPKNQRKEPVVYRPFTSIQLPITMLTASESINAKETPLASGSLINTSADIRKTDTLPENLSGESRKSDAPAFSSTNETNNMAKKPDRNTGVHNYRPFFFLSAAVFAGICIIVIFSRITAGNGSGGITEKIRHVILRK